MEHADRIQADIVRKIRAHLRPKMTRDGQGWHVGGRAKTETTLLEKRRRNPAIQLPYIDDIAGVRVVGDILHSDQKALAVELATLASGVDSPAVKIVDRCKNPRQGYRAVHAIVRIERVHVEVQVRTHLQHHWAELYERIADHFGRWIRYFPIELQSITPEQMIEIGAEPGSNAEDAIHLLAMTQQFAIGIDQFERWDANSHPAFLHWENYGRAKAAGRTSQQDLITRRRELREGDKIYRDTRRVLMDNG